MRSNNAKLFSIVSIFIIPFLIACKDPNSFEPYTYTPKHWNIHIMNSDGSNVKALTHFDHSVWLSDISSLGTKIVYGDGAVAYYYCTMNLDGSNVQSFPYSYLQYSPDENKIVYKEKIGNEINQIFITNSDGTNRVDLYTTSLNNYSTPKFSPDGIRLLYAVNDSIYTMDTDGSEKTFLAIGNYPQYTPAGTHIIY